MRGRPVGLPDADVAAALAAWGVRDPVLTFLPVGWGGHHWRAESGRRRWFVTAAPPSPALDRALAVARRLRDAGLDLVVAPLPTADGGLAREVRGWAVSLFPYVTGSFGSFGDPLPRRLAAALAKLHDATDAVRDLAPVHDVRVPARPALDTALGDLATPWETGPLGERARRLFVAHEGAVRRLLADFDAAVAAPAGPLVVTHGEPHAGNVATTRRGVRLVDWDTVALAPADRDLWFVTGDRTSRYALRWPVEDLALFAQTFRAPHRATKDDRAALGYLAATLAALT